MPFLEMESFSDKLGQYIICFQLIFPTDLFVLEMKMVPFFYDCGNLRVDEIDSQSEYHVEVDL